MIDPRLEDHALGLELQLTELVDGRDRALARGDEATAARCAAEMTALHAELARTADRIAEAVAAPEIRPAA